jgi:hypothetical protein
MPSKMVIADLSRADGIERMHETYGVGRQWGPASLPAERVTLGAGREDGPTSMTKARKTP